MTRLSRLALTAAESLLTDDERERLKAVRLRDEGHGFDAFGLSRDWLALGLLTTRALYRDWFRVESRGVENIPAEGAAILAANHGGMLPFDGLMLWSDVLRRGDPPRVARAVGDHFVPLVPFVGTYFARQGMVGGSRGNVDELLDRGELLLIFPEGTAAIGKPLRQRYQLRAWTVGHAEMAIRHRAPVVPVALLGPDEQFPLVVQLPLRIFGAPYLPVSLLPFPLPVRYRIRYGAAIALHQRYRPADADDPDAVAAAAAEVAAAERALLAEALAERPGVYG